MDLENFKSLLKEKIEFSLTKDQEELTFFLHQFLTSGSSKKVFVLNGYAGTGKTTLVSGLTQILGKLNYKTTLLAPTGRAAKVISSYSGRRAFTIHKMIYTYKYIGGRNVFVLKKNTSKNTIFILLSYLFSTPNSIVHRDASIYLATS